jgi:hypothetical protein
MNRRRGVQTIFFPFPRPCGKFTHTQHQLRKNCGKLKKGKAISLLDIREVFVMLLPFFIHCTFRQPASRSARSE